MATLQDAETFRIDARQRLVESASRLFHARSWGGVSIQEVCDLAEVPKGSVYYYFRSKRDLTLAVLDAEWKSLQEQVFTPALQGDQAALQRFTTFLDLVYGYHRRRSSQEWGAIGGCPIANIGGELSTSEPEIRQKVADILGQCVDHFQEVLQEAVARGEIPNVDTRRLAEKMFAYFEGVLVLAKANDDLELLREIELDPRAFLPADRRPGAENR